MVRRRRPALWAAGEKITCPEDSRLRLLQNGALRTEFVLLNQRRNFPILGAYYTSDSNHLEPTLLVQEGWPGNRELHAFPDREVTSGLE